MVVLHQLVFWRSVTHKDQVIHMMESWPWLTKSGFFLYICSDTFDWVRQSYFANLGSSTSYRIRQQRPTFASHVHQCAFPWQGQDQAPAGSWPCHGQPVTSESVITCFLSFNRSWLVVTTAYKQHSSRAPFVEMLKFNCLPPSQIGSWIKHEVAKTKPNLKYNLFFLKAKIEIQTEKILAYSMPVVTY